MTNLDSILKSRYITLTTKVRLVKDMVSPVVMHGYESWTQPVHPKGNQYLMSLEGLMLKLKFQDFGHLMGKN